MPRGFIGVNRISDEDAGYQKESYDNLSPWMRRLVEQTRRQQDTAVDQARQRQSHQAIVHQVNNIMSNPPRYATVDDAVADMRERTGLSAHLKDIQASESKKKRLELRNIVAQINDAKDGTHISIDIEIPQVLSKYEIESLIDFIKNTIDNGHGLGATVPQLQNDILHMFGPRYRVQPQDIWNDEVAEFLSKFIEQAKIQVTPETQNPHIGKGIGVSEDADPEDQDYFAGCQPASDR